MITFICPRCGTHWDGREDEERKACLMCFPPNVDWRARTEKAEADLASSDNKYNKGLEHARAVMVELEQVKRQVSEMRALLIKLQVSWNTGSLAAEIKVDEMLAALSSGAVNSGVRIEYVIQMVEALQVCQAQSELM
jgi:hypothetical protein